MKKIIFSLICAVAALTLTSCGNDKDYQQAIQTRYDEFMSFYEDLLIADMPDDEKETTFNENYEALMQDIDALVNEGLKKHNDDSVAVMLIGIMNEFELTDGEGILEAIENLGPNAQSAKEIQSLKSTYEKKILTAEGTHFVDFAIEQPNGKTVKLSDFAGNGKYCLVDFWASWCGPCKREIPNLRSIYEDFTDKGLVMVSVAVWDEVQASIDTAKAYDIRWNHILDAQYVPTDLYGIEGIPHIMLIGPDGTILKRNLRGAGIREEIEKYL